MMLTLANRVHSGDDTGIIQKIDAGWFGDVDEDNGFCWIDENISDNNADDS